MLIWTGKGTWGPRPEGSTRSTHYTEHGGPEQPSGQGPRFLPPVQISQIQMVKFDFVVIFCLFGLEEGLGAPVQKAVQVLHVIQNIVNLYRLPDRASEYLLQFKQVKKVTRTSVSIYMAFVFCLFGLEEGLGGPTSIIIRQSKLISISLNTHYN